MIIWSPCITNMAGLLMVRLRIDSKVPWCGSCDWPPVKEGVIKAHFPAHNQDSELEAWKMQLAIISDHQGPQIDTSSRVLLKRRRGLRQRVLSSSVYPCSLYRSVRSERDLVLLFTKSSEPLRRAVGGYHVRARCHWPRSDQRGECFDQVARDDGPDASDIIDE